LKDFIGDLHTAALGSCPGRSLARPMPEKNGFESVGYIDLILKGSCAVNYSDSLTISLAINPTFSAEHFGCLSKPAISKRRKFSI
jgi:hypothetical protein